ncbi:antitoxin Xre/MbcA/ParS toxin-binding domain-containing protein [Pseudomonas leptonychotis]|jgi:putative toxin-antitoxin system antitoxin component (TIGR02293 family)|uniref:antitoxin Xre/MbcA/ParS toxin-binding domain-containing protein n=1 Tax=Pseudomonas leptonychotis TaxID=2448482 RepID=UPI0039EEABC4
MFDYSDPQYTELLALATEVLGSSEIAVAWMNGPALGLNGSRPIDLIFDQNSAEKVKTLLDRMRYGIYH